MTKTDRIEALLALREKATKGPWKVWDGPDYVGGGRDLCIGSGETWLVNMDHRRCQNQAHHIGCHDDGCKLEGDADVCSVGDSVTAEQKSTAGFIAACGSNLDPILRDALRWREALEKILDAGIEDVADDPLWPQDTARKALDGDE